MTTITKEWLQSQISSIEAVGITDSNTLQAFKIALASLTAETVYQYQSGIYNEDSGETEWYWDDCDQGFYLQYAADRRRIVYTAPPMPEYELNAIVDRLNASGYECGDGEVTTRNAAVVVDILLQQLDDAVQGTKRPASAGSAALLQGSQPVSNRDELSSPAIPDGYVLVPKRLTAENFAKAALSGEFSETKFINCPECFGDDECETCDGSGRIEISVPVSWTNIKAIWAKGVEHFAAAPKQETL